MAYKGFRKSVEYLKTLKILKILSTGDPNNTPGFEIWRFRKKLKAKKTQSGGKKLKLKQFFEKTQEIF